MAEDKSGGDEPKGAEAVEKLEDEKLIGEKKQETEKKPPQKSSEDKKAPEDKKEDKKAPEDKKEDKKGDKKGEKVDIVSESIYLIPLGSVHRTRPRYRRAGKAVVFVLKYLRRHTKSENIRIGQDLNNYIWSKGGSNPPRRVQVKAVRDSNGTVTASLLS